MRMRIVIAGGHGQVALRLERLLHARGDAVAGIIRKPGQLTDGPGAGTVALAASTGRGAVPRDDVAAVIAALLDEPRTAGQTLELISGAVQVADAVANAAG
jgi:hypothetical protein